MVDENKQPVAGGRILLISKEYEEGLLRYVVRDSAKTDDRGEYVLQRVTAGRSHWVMADKPSEPVRPVSEAPVDPKLRKAVLAPTYYPNADMIEGAIPLILRPGERREGVDIRMLRTASYCVEGALNAGGGPAVLDFSIRQQSPAGFEMPAFQRGGRTGPDGKIRVCGLASGQYTLTAFKLTTTPAETPPLFGKETVTIDKTDVRGVTVAAYGTLPVAGQVVWAGKPPDRLAAASLSVAVRPAGRNYFMGEETYARSSVPGQFTLRGLLLDDYLVRVFPASPEVYVKDITYGGQSIKSKPFRPGSAFIDSELRIIVGHDGGAVRAKVVDKDDNLVPDSFVLIIPVEVNSEAELASLLMSSQTDQGGSCSFQSVTPGKYHVLAVRSKIDLTAENVSWLWRARSSRAKNIEIGPRATQEVNVEVTEIGH